MVRVSVSLVLVILLTACGGEAEQPLPTRMQFDPAPTEVAQATTATEAVTADVNAGENVRSTLPPTWTITPTSSITSTVTVTPSLTITNTSTPTVTVTPSETLEPNPMQFLIQTAENVTVAPTRPFVPTPTADPNAVVIPPSPTAANCQYLPPGGFAQVVQNNPALTGQIGCPVGAPPVTTSFPTSHQPFERGSMVWVGESPSSIYVLLDNGTFQRYDDTFTEGVDPESGGETPPEGLLEPTRGFGKIWRENPAVRDALGWALNPEVGGQATVQEFASGRMAYTTSRNDIIVLDYAGDVRNSGTWQAVTGQF